MPPFLLQLLILVFFPFVSRRVGRFPAIRDWLSPVVLCYAIGILLRNFPLIPLNEHLSNTATEVSVAMAIPLLLYSSAGNDWLKIGKTAFWSFFLCVLSGLLGTMITALVFSGSFSDSWRLSGMLVGIYTGGIPNLHAIGLALEAPKETILLLNASDIFLGGIYLLLLSSVAPGLLAKLLKPFRNPQLMEHQEPEDEEHTNLQWQDYLPGILATVLIIGMTMGLTKLIWGNLQQSTFIILTLTTLSLVVSFSPLSRRFKGTYRAGEYFLLIFSVALGMLADFGSILEKGTPLLKYSAVALCSSILLHLLFARLFRIDRDTFIITSTAAIFGPAFIGPIASTLNNRKLILPGITLALLGFAMGNYLGIGLARVLQWAFY
ncbi:MAG: hypothetical protein DHS20C18_44110 [Saprospiraceae bacterium]|nr:MAG: hypothetical protein DHS20C18_44110 [Saprospiraceae bacterium]